MSMTFTIDDQAIADYMAFAETDYIRDAAYFMDDLKERMLLDRQSYGDPLPWSKTHEIFRMRPGEVTLWAGINGHMKSMVTSQVMSWMLPEHNVTVASMEMQPSSSLERMAKMCGCNNWEDMRRWLNWASGRLSIYDQLDTVHSDRVLAMVHAAATIYNSKHIVIDSLMKCMGGVRDNEKNGKQTDFLNALTRLAKLHNIHVHLVHHMRKGESEERIPDKFMVKGAGEITDQIDNLVIVHANKRKQRVLDSGDLDAIEEVQNERDLTLRVAKQRHGEWEGDIKLWFDPASLQHIPNRTGGTMPWPYPGATILDHTVTTSEENSGRPLGENPAGFPEFPETGIQ